MMLLSLIPEMNIINNNASSRTFQANKDICTVELDRLSLNETK